MFLQNKFTLVLLHLFLFIVSVCAEAHITEKTVIKIDDNENIYLFDENLLLSWNKTKVNLDGSPVYKEEQGQIINVIVNPNESGPIAAIINRSSTEKTHFFIHLLNKDNEIKKFPSIIKPFDSGLPEILFSNSNLIMLYPEAQHISYYDFHGTLREDFDLFTEKSRSHEKKILHSGDVLNNIYLLGMKSADLKNDQNVTLFTKEDQLKLLTELPLTVPYHFSISNKNISAILGTKSVSDSYKQKPFLLFLNDSQSIINQPIELKQLPQKIIWIEENLYLIYRDHLLIYNTHAHSLPQLIPFNSKMYPFEVFTNGNSLFIVSGKGVGADKNGNFYQLVELMEFDTDTNSMVNRVLHEGRVETVKYFPSENNASFYLRIDNQIVKYTISN